MLLEEILNLELEDAEIAGDLAVYLEGNSTILESTARILRFNYERAKNDPRPRVMVLGRWLHPRTGNKIVVGINLNYLDEDEIHRLNRLLPRIMKPDTLKERWWTGYRLLRGIWLKAYRQYDERFIHSLDQADIEPSPEDYESPKQPGEPSDAEKTSPKAASAVNKLKSIEAQKQGKPPKEPKKRRSITRFAKDTIKKLSNFIRTKLSRNKQQLKAKQETEKAKIKKEPQKAIKAIDDIENIEKEHDVKQNVDDRLDTLGDKYDTIEGLRCLDTLIEATIKPKALRWRSPANYVFWHGVEKFTEYQPRLRGKVLDYANGTKLIAVYNISEDKMIVDLVETPQEILSAANWDWGNTIRITVDNGVHVDHNIADSKAIMKRIRRNQLWGVIQEAAADRQK